MFWIGPRVESCYRDDAVASQADVIRLDEATIERALPLISIGLEKYSWLQAALATTDVAHDRSFQTRFNGFYRVRRNAAWQSVFYTLLQQQKGQRQSFDWILRALHAATGRAEASFASKLAATIDPDQPVIDSWILKNVGLRLPYAGVVDARLVRIVELHDRIARIYAEYLATEMGQRLTTRFEECYPDRHLTRIKMLDLVLWQAR